MEMDKKKPVDEGHDRFAIFSKRVDTCRSDMDRFRALEVLKVKNRNSMKNIGKFILGKQPYLVSSGKVLSVTDMYCKELNLPTEIKLLSLELFERFMVCLSNGLMQQASIMSYRMYTENADGYCKELQTVFELAPLYLIASVQIAAKFENRDLPLTSPKKTVAYLKKSGYDATVADLLEAEMKMLGTINYDLYIITKYNAVEDLICTRRNTAFLEIAAFVFPKAVEVLEMLAKCHRQIFDEVFHNLGYKITKLEKLNSQSLQESEYDAVWVGASVILASINLVRLKHLSTDRAEKLSKVLLKELADDLKDTRSEKELRVLAWILQRKFSSLGFRANLL